MALTEAMTRIRLPETGLSTLFGTHDEHLERVEEAFGVTVSARGGAVTIEGAPEDEEVVARLFRELGELLERGHRFDQHDVRTAIRLLQEDPEAPVAQFIAGDGHVTAVRRLVDPRSLAQQQYIQAMLDYDIVVAIGPAGTGKTFLAVAMAAMALSEQQVRRIILCRPAVEAGEKLGFLPGDLAEKVNPYLRPLYDSLYDLIGFERVQRMLERETIEVAPLAFMRGRTLNDSFVILDEAQNTTSDQMKMFLTRIGFDSKAVINGDVTQIDLPHGKISGLKESERVLAGIEGIEFVRFTERDVVRHPLVQEIITAYERHGEEHEKVGEGQTAD